MALPPRIIPCRIVLAAHERPLGLDFSESRKRVLGIGGKIHDLEGFRNDTFGQMVCGIACKDRHVETRFAHRIVYFPYILLVISEEAVLILVLRHEYRSAMRDLKIFELGCDAAQICLGGLQISRIAGAHADICGPLVE